MPNDYFLKIRYIFTITIRRWVVNKKKIHYFVYKDSPSASYIQNCKSGPKFFWLKLEMPESYCFKLKNGAKVLVACNWDNLTIHGRLTHPFNKEDCKVGKHTSFRHELCVSIWPLYVQDLIQCAVTSVKIFPYYDVLHFDPQFLRCPVDHLCIRREFCISRARLQPTATGRTMSFISIKCPFCWFILTVYLVQTIYVNYPFRKMISLMYSVYIHGIW